MGQTKDFFKTKRKWSVFKDDILDYYLTPYLSKILMTYRPVTLIDCFAGKGRFDDGSFGSPVIIAEHIKQVMESDRKNKSIDAIFIEKKYHKELISNLTQFQRCTVWAGTFEDNVAKITNINRQRNIFLYIDPYGIKSLDFNRFCAIKEHCFNSVEMLLNFNSFGFLREGCRLLNVDINPLTEDDDDDYITEDTNSKENMNRIAYGDYWQSIIEDYKKGKVDLRIAEEELVKKYTEKLKLLFNYVVNIPIRTKSINIPKYRLVFGTNNQDGLLLMAENMHKKWKNILSTQRDRQEVLFECDTPDLTFQFVEYDLKKEIIKAIGNNNGRLSLKELIVKLIGTFGINYSEKEIKNKISEMDGKEITVNRYPQYTKTNKLVTSMDFDKYDITVGLK